MCTVTVITTDRGIRLACNRDEAKRRAPAIPPRSVDADGTACLMPTDPGSNGTWIAANEHALCLTLLNRNARPYPASGARSRGELIPMLINAQRLRDVIDRLSAIDADDFGPFTLVGIDAAGDGFAWIGDRDADGRAAVTVWARDRLPALFTSSSLGDALVDPPRRRLFESWFTREHSAEEPADRQDAFHRHRWADRPELSVNMDRSDARSVSLTAVECSGDAVTMRYHAGPPGEPAREAMLTLARGVVRA